MNLAHILREQAAIRPNQAAIIDTRCGKPIHHHWRIWKVRNRFVLMRYVLRSGYNLF